MRERLLSVARLGCSRLGAFGLDQRGNIAILGALLILPLTLLSGGAADYSRAHQVRSALQDALDAATLAGAAAGNSSTTAALSFHPEASPGVVVAAPAFTTDSTSGNFSGSVSAQVPNAFLSIAGIANMTVNVRSATNVLRVQSDVCLTALGATGPGLVRSGSGEVSAPNCRFDIRSTATPAASLGGSGGVVSTADLCVRGTTVYGSAPNLRTGCTISNPLKIRQAAAMPTPGPCTASKTDVNITDAWVGVIEPGTWCGLRITSGQVLTMQPGVYVFRASPTGGPSFSYTGGGSLSGSGVFLYFVQNGEINLSGSGQLNLSAMTSGAYRGVLFHESDGLAQSNVSLKRADGAVLRGLINLPSRNFTVDGSGSAVMDEVNMLVNRLTTNGNGSWTFKAAPSSAFQVGVPYLKS